MNKDYSFVFFVFIIFISIFSSCSTVDKTTLKKELVRGQEHFSYTDKNGSFEMLLSSGFSKKEHSFFTKHSLEIGNKDAEKTLEQSVAFSSLGTLKKSKVILRPKISQYSVWFEGKKYFSELKLNVAQKAIDVKMISPEAQWNGMKQVRLPNSEALYCFFSQVIECAKVMGFIKESIKREAGVMNFYVIWEGYPYLNETFSNFPSELFSRAQLEYDGKMKDEERRFNLKVAGQSIFFIVDQKEQMKKMLWVSQGISMISRASDKTSNKISSKTVSDGVVSGGSLE